MSSLRQPTAPELDFTPPRVGSISSYRQKIFGLSVVFYAVLLVFMYMVDPDLAFKAIGMAILFGIMTFIIPSVAPRLFFLLANIPGWIFHRLSSRSDKLEKLFSNFYFDSKTSEIVVRSFVEDIRLPIELLQDFQHSKDSENIVHFQFSEATDPAVCEAIRTENLSLKPAEFEKAFFALRSKAVS